MIYISLCGFFRSPKIPQGPQMRKITFVIISGAMINKPKMQNAKIFPECKATSLSIYV